MLNLRFWSVLSASAVVSFLVATGCALSQDGNEWVPAADADEQIAKESSAILNLPHKVCAVADQDPVEPWWNATVVPDGWTKATCQNWSNSLPGAPSVSSYRLGCVFTNSYSWGSLGGGTPPSNCGW
jgi:hypothetical protein